jgi:hypothetical protein
MLKLLHYQEHGENKGSQMGHTKKIFEKTNAVRAEFDRTKFVETEFDLTVKPELTTTSD